MTDSHSDEEKARQELERKKAWDKARKNSVEGTFLTILFFGGIAFAVLVLLFGFADLQGTPDVDKLPPSWNP